MRLWDVKGKKLLTSMEGHFGLVHCVACSPSTAHVRRLGLRGDVVVFNQRLATRATFIHGKGKPGCGGVSDSKIFLLSIVFVPATASPSGSFLIQAKDSHVLVWHLLPSINKVQCHHITLC